MYFFIDPSKLKEQNEDDCYGPHSEDVYNVTSKFVLDEEAKAYACVTGQIIIQPSNEDDSLVNLILKPLNPGSHAKYFVYRGLKKTSFLVEEEMSTSEFPLVVTSSEDTSEFINRIWEDSTNYLDGQESIPNDDAQLYADSLGYIEEDSLDKLFSNNNSIVALKGEWIGNFAANYISGDGEKKIGFEVISETNRFLVDSAYLRKGSHQIDVSDLEGFARKMKREEILSFIDPAAFFGTFVKKGVYFFENSAIINANNRRLYNRIIKKFYSKNRIYLDIRSEKGYSYNFYGNYNNNNSMSVRLPYRTLGSRGIKYEFESWPILVLEDIPPSDTLNYNTLNIQLRRNDNTNPIVYVSNNYFIKRHNNFNRKVYLKNDDDNKASKYFDTSTLRNPQSEWTNNIGLNLFNELLGNNRKCIAQYIKLHYFKTKHHADSPLTNIKYYDSAFCSIDINNLGNDTHPTKHIESDNPIYVREPNNDDGTGNFQLTMRNGAYWDESKILFYSKMEYIDHAKSSEKEYLNTYRQKLELNNNKYNNSGIKKKTDIICREYQISANETVRIPGVNFYKADFSSKNYKENLMLLGLAKSELHSIQQNEELSQLHYRYIYLEQVDNPHDTLPDVNNNNIQYKYFVYRLQLQGLNEEGEVVNDIIPTHEGSPIFLFSRDNQFFSSSNFSSDIPLTTGRLGQNQLNRVEFHIYQNGGIKINDNIDLALYLANANNVRNQISYIYFARNSNSTPNDILDLCRLDFHMTNKKENGRWEALSDHPDNSNLRNQIYRPLRNILGYTLNIIDHQIPFVAGVDARVSAENQRGDVLTDGPYTFRERNEQRQIEIITEKRRRIYRNKGKRTFLVHFDENTISTIQINNVQLRFSYSQTKRYYCLPHLAAAVIGSLVDISAQTELRCIGFAYSNATCFPSSEHVNGEAIDSSYVDQDLVTNQIRVDALDKFGFGEILRGSQPHFSSALTTATNGGILHRTHLHSADLNLNDFEE